MTPLSAPQALDQYFLEARGKLLELAAILDRIQRGGQSDDALRDPRMVKIRESLQILASGTSSRAEQIQQVFSDQYDPNWRRPEPREIPS